MKKHIAAAGLQPALAGIFIKARHLLQKKPLVIGKDLEAPVANRRQQALIFNLLAEKAG